MAALALMGTLASCQSDDDFTVTRPANAVGINVSVGSLQTTRSNAIATDDMQRQFNQGDQISVSTNATRKPSSSSARQPRTRLGQRPWQASSSSGHSPCSPSRPTIP